MVVGRMSGGGDRCDVGREVVVSKKNDRGKRRTKAVHVSNMEVNQ